VAGKRVKLESPKDLLFFINSETVPVLLGTAGLALLELTKIPDHWPIKYFIDDYRLPIIFALAALVVLPPPISRGIGHLRDRDDAARKSAEGATAFRALASRASNFIFKLREALAGNAGNTYQHHLLEECKAYIESRPMPGSAERPTDIRVEASYYSARITGQTIFLDRKLFTNSEPSRMRAKFSNSRGSGNSEGRKTVEAIWAGRYIFCGDLTDAKEASEHEVPDGSNRPYRAFLSVPVFRDRKAVGDGRILGMLSINVSRVGVISESDHHILEVYAWFLAAAFEADHFGNKLRMMGVSIAPSS
jgi:hypothetical protein